MKCDDCLNILEAYIDREATERESELVRAHLITCAACTSEFEAIVAQQEMYERYDRELKASPATWNGIAARIATEAPAPKRESSDLRSWFSGLFALPRLGFAFSGAAALVIMAIAVGFLYWRTRPVDQTPTPVAQKDNQAPQSPSPASTAVNTGNPDDTGRTGNSGVSPTSGGIKTPVVEIASAAGPNSRKAIDKGPKGDQSGDVLFKDTAFNELGDRDTATHLEQAENLLESFRNIKTSDDDQEVDVSYERAESRRLLNENVVMRRDAEMSGKFPVKSVLGSLEPFLIDIANLPDKAAARDVQQIKDRVQRTEIVAELRIY